MTWYCCSANYPGHEKTCINYENTDETSLVNNIILGAAELVAAIERMKNKVPLGVIAWHEPLKILLDKWEKKT